MCRHKGGNNNSVMIYSINAILRVVTEHRQSSEQMVVSCKVDPSCVLMEKRNPSPHITTIHPCHYTALTARRTLSLVAQLISYFLITL